MGDLVRMTDSPRARWAVINKSKKLFLSRRQTRFEAESYFIKHMHSVEEDLWLVQEHDAEGYKDTEATEMGSL